MTLDVRDAISASTGVVDDTSRKSKTRGALTALNRKIEKLLDLANDEESAAISGYMRASLLEQDGELTRLEQISLAMYERAKRGDVKAATLLLDRAFGKQGDSAASRQAVNQIALYVSQLAPVAARLTSRGRTTVYDDEPDPGKAVAVIEPPLGQPHVEHPQNTSSQVIEDAEFTDDTR